MGMDSICILRAVVGFLFRLATKGRNKMALHTTRKLEIIGRLIVCFAAVTKFIDGDAYKIDVSTYRQRCSAAAFHHDVGSHDVS